MSKNDTERACVLCGLPIEGKPVVLETREGRLEFCCEGCLGIYRLLNDVEELPHAGGDGGSSKERGTA